MTSVSNVSHGSAVPVTPTKSVPSKEEHTLYKGLTTPTIHAPFCPSPERSNLWSQLSRPDKNDLESIEKSICRHVSKTLARSSSNVDGFAAYQATALSVRDRLIDLWNATQQFHTARDSKRVYYLSLEFVILWSNFYSCWDVV
jgi:starch phosphorylase